jgi:hypothetical protein
MKGRKHHSGHHAEHEGHKPHHRRRGGGLHEPKVEDAGGNPEVEKEAKKVKSIGKIGGIKSAFRGDRKHGGRACHAEGGEAKERKRGGRAHHHADGGPAEGGENPAERKHGGRAHHKHHEHESHEGAEERKRGGGVHHKGHHGGHDGHGMPTVHHGEGGVAHHHTHAGGHHHKGHASGGAAGGADMNPYSSAGKQLRRKGGHCG